MINETNVKQIKFEIKVAIINATNRSNDVLHISKLANEHLKFHFKSGNISNLIQIRKCFIQIEKDPKNIEKLNWYERYKDNNDIETIRINIKDRFSIVRKNSNIHVVSLIGHPKDYNYYL